MKKWILLSLIFGSALLAQNLDNRIRSAVFHFVANRVQADSFSVFIELPNNLPDLAVSDNNYQLNVEWSKGNRALSGRIMLPVRISKNQRHYSTVQVITEIQRFERVCVTNGILDRHHLITNTDIRFELRNVTKLHQIPIQTVSECVGKRTRRMISAERLLTVDMIQSPPLVQRGKAVKVVLCHHNLEITTSGVAKEDGWLGDHIRVRHAQSRQDIYCVVKSDHLVQASM